MNDGGGYAVTIFNNDLYFGLSNAFINFHFPTSKI